VKTNKTEEWVNGVRMMNCIKIYGLDITTYDYLCVRKRRSRGCPLMFWKHNLNIKSDEIVEWKVDTGKDGDVPGRVLRKSLSLSYDDNDMGKHTMLMRVTGNYPHNERMDVLQECIHIVGVDDTSSHISALIQYKDNEEKLNRIRLAYEKLKENQSKVKVTQKDKDDAMKRLTTSHPAYLEIISKTRSKPNERKCERRRNRQLQPEPSPFSDEHTSPNRQRVSLIKNS